MRPRPQLESDLGTTKSSSGNNKQKEIKHTGQNSEQPDSHWFCFSVLPAAYVHRPRPANKKLGVYVLKNLKKISYLSFCALFVSFVFVSTGVAQERQRVVKTISSRPTNQPPIPSATTDKTKSLTSSLPSNAPTNRPVLTNQIVLAPAENKEPLVKKTASMSAMHAASASLAAGRMVYNGTASLQILRGIEARFGIPYRYGSSGPNRYDCSGFVWAVFNDAGINFARSSARSLWAMSIPVSGGEQYKFGTLVFLNGLGHIGIVADENGFYHASSSKGITYSPFKGYWEKRIVGFRRLPATPSAPVTTPVIDASAGYAN
jgi:cell wall-associated NlpC family hydrolase